MKNSYNTLYSKENTGDQVLELFQREVKWFILTHPPTGLVQYRPGATASYVSECLL